MDDSVIDEISMVMEEMIVWEVNGHYIIFTSREKLEKYSGDIEI